MPQIVFGIQFLNLVFLKWHFRTALGIGRKTDMVKEIGIFSCGLVAVGVSFVFARTDFT